jgi:hypothetical protein
MVSFFELGEFSFQFINPGSPEVDLIGDALCYARMASINSATVRGQNL